MLGMTPAIFQELVSVANETGLTVDRIIEDAILNWIRFEAPTYMRNAQIIKDFSTAKRHTHKLIEGGRIKPRMDAPRRMALTPSTARSEL